MKRAQYVGEFERVRLSAMKVAMLVLLMMSASHLHAHECHADPRMAYETLMRTATQRTTHQHININTASAGELATLHGVGAKTAQAIVDYREMFGRFERVDDLTRVKGVGAKTLEKNRHRLTVQ